MKKLQEAARQEFPQEKEEANYDNGAYNNYDYDNDYDYNNYGAYCYYNYDYNDYDYNNNAAPKVQRLQLRRLQQQYDKVREAEYLEK